jgi:hypothetical protein
MLTRSKNAPKKCEGERGEINTHALVDPHCQLRVHNRPVAVPVGMVAAMTSW